jgi:hypothetical protein
MLLGSVCETKEGAMGGDQPQPSDDLLRKVMQIVGIKSLVHPSHRGGFSKFGVLVTSRELRRRNKMARTYRVSGRLFSCLVFKDSWVETTRLGVSVQKYKPGDWEEKVDRLYEYAENFRQEHRNNPEIFASDTMP